MIEEIWKPIEWTEGGYEVSNLGRVRSMKQYYGVIARIMPATTQKKGYKAVMFHINGKAKCAKVHRLVAEAFIPNPDNLPEVNHKDGNKGNNHVSNLEWCTRSHNVKHSYDTGLKQPHRWTAEERKQISDRNKGQVVSNKQRQQISEALKGRPRPDVSARQKGKAPSRKAIEASIATRKRKAEERMAERAMQPKKPRAKGWHWSDEAKQAASERAKGKPHPRKSGTKGWKWSEEAKQRFREQRMKRGSK